MGREPRLPLWFLVANWALIVAAFAIGALVGGRHRIDLPPPQGQALELVYGEILKSHVEAQDGRALLDRAIAAMAKVDEYSMYVPPADLARYEEASTGHYEGVGMVQMLHGEDVVVHFPFAGGPAESAGVRPGDRIVAVDGTPTASLPLEQRSQRLLELVRGPAGTDVKLRIARDDGEVELVVRRGGVQRAAVKWVHFADREQGLGYLHVADFHRGVADGVLAAIERLQQQAPLRGLVIDLRFDGGGNLDECLHLARLFQPSGTIVSTRRRDEVLETHAADPRLCRFPDLPLTVLVNEHTASASEVFAGCLQDHGRAAIVGVRTFGKGVVNTVYSWRDLPFKLKLTTAHYFTPDGRNIERRSLAKSPNAGNGTGGPGGPGEADPGGIRPDVVAPLPKEQLAALARRLDDHEPPPAHRAAFAAVAAQYGVPVPAPPDAQEDPQLAAAVAALRARITRAGAPGQGR
ncbi:MAG: S41 family peptidase [Planctomycetes bacterium]|nr:S41 family peptidase [Planctomycetota bacterium]